MNVKERVLTARVIEKAEKNAEYLKRLGVKIVKPKRPCVASPPRKNRLHK